MSEDDREGSSGDLDRMRAEADRLGFDVSDALLEGCLDTARDLERTAGDLGTEATSTATRSPEVAPAGDHREFLATYETPRQESETGALAGRRVALKDNVAVADLPMTCGSDRVAVTPETDAAVTERLLAAGASVVGKANMDAFAFGPSGEFSDYGPVENPTATDRVPGGSSSGSGAAVAAGTVDVALGTDTGGSVRIPAACCGVVGVKPTHGVVPRHGFVSFAPSLDTIGPLARDVETARRALTAIAGPDPRDPTTSSRGLPARGTDDTLSEDGTLPENATVGLPTSFFEASDDVVSESVREAVAAADVEATSVELDRGAIEEAYFLVGAAEFVWYLDQTGVVRGQGPDYTPAVRSLLAAVKEADLGDHVASRLLASAFLDTETDGEAYLAARREAIAFGERVQDALADVDALVMPTLRTLPPTRGRMETTADLLTLLGNTAPFNLAGTPATAVPVDTVDGLSVSAQVVGAPFDDHVTMAIADRLQS
ncbi:amidase family protein [Halopenitus sp. POP-27]|uniref:amidase n=1 Tax=Halopenitus sp. POP-27 TaxID=2994425 RepID=UPI0024687C1B|nr:amidase family protein [Halopenitus sp. POP-27]